MKGTLAETAGLHRSDQVFDGNETSTGTRGKVIITTKWQGTWLDSVHVLVFCGMENLWATKLAILLRWLCLNDHGKTDIYGAEAISKDKCQRSTLAPPVYNNMKKKMKMELLSKKKQDLKDFGKTFSLCILYNHSNDGHDDVCLENTKDVAGGPSDKETA